MFCLQRPAATFMFWLFCLITSIWKQFCFKISIFFSNLFFLVALSSKHSWLPAAVKFCFASTPFYSQIQMSQHLEKQEWKSLICFQVQVIFDYLPCFVTWVMRESVQISLRFWLGAESIPESGPLLLKPRSSSLSNCPGVSDVLRLLASEDFSSPPVLSPDW